MENIPAALTICPSFSLLAISPPFLSRGCRGRQQKKGTYRSRRQTGHNLEVRSLSGYDADIESGDEGDCELENDGDSSEGFLSCREYGRIGTGVNDNFGHIALDGGILESESTYKKPCNSQHNGSDSVGTATCISMQLVGSKVRLLYLADGSRAHLGEFNLPLAEQIQG